MQRFAIHYTPGKSWKIDQPWSEQGLYAHGEYMDELYTKGILLYGGPFDDHKGGLAIVEADSFDQVAQIILNDPAVIDKIFEANAHPWITVFDQPKKVNFFRQRQPNIETVP